LPAFCNMWGVAVAIVTGSSWLCPAVCAGSWGADLSCSTHLPSGCPQHTQHGQAAPHSALQQPACARRQGDPGGQGTHTARGRQGRGCSSCCACSCTRSPASGTAVSDLLPRPANVLRSALTRIAHNCWHSTLWHISQHANVQCSRRAQCVEPGLTF
jgi:hypothetical protein